MASAGSAAADEMLRLLQLERVAAAPGLLRMVTARFRPPQQAQLLATLRALGEEDEDEQEDESEGELRHGLVLRGELALARLAEHFDRELDVRAELERFLLDLLKMLHFVASKDAKMSAISAVRDPRVLLFASLGGRLDRDRLGKVFQALGTSASAVYCRVAATLPPKYLQELLRHFADDLADLQAWIKWLAGLRGSDLPGQGKHQTSLPPFQLATEFIGRCVREQCLPCWLTLLRPLDAGDRLAVTAVAYALPVSTAIVSGMLAVGATASPLKKLGHFLETAAVAPHKLLELDESVRRALPLLLDEFPTITLQLVLTKFGTNSALMELITQRGLALVGRTGMLHLLESLTLLSVAPQTVEGFLAALFAFKRLHVLLTLFFQLEASSQLSVIQLTARVHAASAGQEASGGGRGGASTAGCLFDLLLVGAQGRAMEAILRNLAALRPELVVNMLGATALPAEFDDDESPPADELAVLGECLEAAVDPAALTHILPIFLGLTQEMRVLLVEWVRDVPDSVAQPVYRVLQRLLDPQRAATGDAKEGDRTSPAHKKAERVVEMLASLPAKEKLLLCREILSKEAAGASDGGDGDASVDEQVLLFLADIRDVDGSQCRKMLRLLRLIPRQEHGAFLLLLRTQPAAQQEALVRFMRSLPTDANLRLLRHVAAFETDTVDALFELLLLIPKVEYPALAKLLTSVNVTTPQLVTLVTVAATMKNQAASRELVMFTSDLPPETRITFFDVLAEESPEKGVLLRMMSLSSRVSSPLLCRLVELLHRMRSWEVRSAFVEQLRTLELESDVEQIIDMLWDQEVLTLRWAVMLLSPFATQTRVTFCRVMLELNGATERRDVLAKLIEIPKNRIGELMAAVCDDQCSPVSASFLRIVGRLEPQYQFPLLTLLKKDAWWFFVHLMTTAASKSEDYSDRASPREDKPLDAVNAMASVLVRLVGDSNHLALFRSVVESALRCSVSLDSIVSVVTAFVESMDRLLGLLRYVHGLGARRRVASARVPLLFRVLGACSQPVLVFNICRIADVDDAMFALQRLDHIQR